MILIIHILIAVFSIIYSVFSALKPSKNSVVVLSILTFLTISTGIGLIVINPANLGKFCLSGVVYLVFMYFSGKLASKKKAVPIISKPSSTATL